MIGEHFAYVSDVQRTRLFRAAIARAVRPTDHVLDLGCGVGVLGLLCLQAGAARVTALDQGAVSEVAARVFDRAGLGDRVTVVRGLSDRVGLAGKADLIVCDHVGFFALDYGILGMLQDARARLLAPGGRILPQGVTLFAAPVGSAECARLAHGWAAPGIPGDLHWLRDYAVNTKHAVSLDPEHVLGEPAPLGEIDFRTETRSFFSLAAETRVTRAGEMHGIAGWFGCTLAGGVTMTNAPVVPRGARERIDRHQAFFPIAEPVEVSPGDVVRLSLAMRPDEHSFAWTVEHVPEGGQARRRFRQATLKSDLAGAADYRRARADHVPVPTAEARAGQIVLGYCDGVRTVAEIEAAVLRDHPDLFPTPAAISAFVAHWLGSRTE